MPRWSSAPIFRLYSIRHEAGLFHNFNNISVRNVALNDAPFAVGAVNVRTRVQVPEWRRLLNGIDPFVMLPRMIRPKPSMASASIPARASLAGKSG